MGDKFDNIRRGLEEMTKQLDDDVPSIHLIRTSFLHETAPMYCTDQPAFLNGVFEVETTLEPSALLERLKKIEQHAGRNINSSQRYGPRPLDLDILIYQKVKLDCPEPESLPEYESVIMDDQESKLPLTIPHPRMQERDFVLTPICEIDSQIMHPQLLKSMGELKEQLRREVAFDAVRVIPLPNRRFLRLNETIIMGILNVTPDSFSDGGKLQGSVSLAVDQALQMEKDGAGIIDIGGESTRPGAEEVRIEEEIERTIPVIEALRKVSEIPISIDTRRAAVADAALRAGADIVNDVSGGTFDPLMLSVVAQHGVPFLMMHMRGTPQTMTRHTKYESGVVEEVAANLMERSRTAAAAGIPRWLHILDPGIGFAKDHKGNLTLLKNFDMFRGLIENYPVLVGPSRKKFLGTITGENHPADRDFATIAACLACITPTSSQYGTILRVHNVKAVKQAAQVFDAIIQSDD